MRALGVLCIALGLVACIQQNLVPCGDKLCPAGTQCIASQFCATTEQLAECAGADDGDSCAVNAAVGQCTSGVCIAVGCGNGIIDDDEVCDDRNTSYGDECSGDCRSLEVCGNGIVDLDEECDCGGDAATKPDRCRFANADDLDADCSTTCELRYCGDGQLNALEQCDTTELGGETCSDFGYYRGQLTCTNLCDFNVSTCSGRCGDGIVEPVAGEFCDQSLPVGSCLEYGYDAGSIACSGACSPDVRDCERFGWQRIDDKAARDVWTGDTQVLVVAADATAYMVINGIRDLAPAGDYRLATGHGVRAFAIGLAKLAIWSGTAWSQVNVGWSSGTPTWATAHGTLGLFVVVDGNVWRYANSTWTQTTLTGQLGVTATSARVVAWSSSVVSDSLDGATWSSIMLPSSSKPITLVVGALNEYLWLSRQDELYMRAFGTWTPRGIRIITRGSASASGALIGLAPDLVRAIHPSNVGEIATPVQGTRVSTSADGGIVLSGVTGTYRLRNGTWDSYYVHGSNAFEEEDALEQIQAQGSKRIAIGKWGAWLAQAPNNEYLPLFEYDPNIETNAAAGVYSLDRDAVLIATAAGIYNYSTGVLEVASATPFVTLFATDKAVLAGGYGVLAIEREDVWQTYATNVDTVALSYVDGHPPLALSATGQLYFIEEVDEMTVSFELVPARPNATEAIVDALLLGDGSIAAISAKELWIYDNGSWTSANIPLTQALTLSGTAQDDVFVGGSGSSFTGSTGLAYWDGKAFTPVRTPANNITDLTVTETVIVYVTYGTHVHELTRVVKW